MYTPSNLYAVTNTMQIQMLRCGFHKDFQKFSLMIILSYNKNFENRQILVTLDEFEENLKTFF